MEIKKEKGGIPMVEPVARMETLREMLLCAEGLYSFVFSNQMELISSNCPEPEFFSGLFTLGPCRKLAETYFSNHSEPLVVIDRIGFAWIVVRTLDPQPVYHLLGPLFTVNASEAYLRQLCRQMKLPPKLSQVLIEKTDFFPVISLHAALRYAVMLHYCVTGKEISSKAVQTISEVMSIPQDERWAGTNWHGTWQMEQQLLQSVREGRMIRPSQLIAGTVGPMSVDDPLRQAKNEVIVFTALCIRAAIDVGVSPEGAYNLSDYYIQRCESCNNIVDAQNCGLEMYEMLIQRVRQCKKNSKYSPAVTACTEYVATHISEKITLAQMAKELGYTTYYLSRKFQAEVGESIGNYIHRQKIETAKNMLDDPSMGAAMVGEMLAFSSPSFFGSTFKKFAGMTPTEYQNRRKC